MSYEFPQWCYSPGAVVSVRYSYRKKNHYRETNQSAQTMLARVASHDSLQTKPRLAVRHEQHTSADMSRQRSSRLGHWKTQACICLSACLSGSGPLCLYDSRQHEHVHNHPRKLLRLATRLEFTSRLLGARPWPEQAGETVSEFVAPALLQQNGSQRVGSPPRHRRQRAR